MTHHPRCPVCGCPAPADAEGILQLHFDSRSEVWCSNRPATPHREPWWRRGRRSGADAPRRSSYIPLH